MQTQVSLPMPSRVVTSWAILYNGMVSRIKINGLSSSGRKKADPSTERFSSDPAAINPAPTSAPVKACVVEIGKPRTVASMTVEAAPAATAVRKFGDADTASGTRPLPENACTSASARNTEQTQPASVASVPIRSAVLKVVVLLP